MLIDKGAMITQYMLIIHQLYQWSVLSSLDGMQQMIECSLQLQETWVWLTWTWHLRDLRPDLDLQKMNCEHVCCPVPHCACSVCFNVQCMHIQSLNVCMRVQRPVKKTVTVGGSRVASTSSPQLYIQWMPVICGIRQYKSAYWPLNSMLA